MHYGDFNTTLESRGPVEEHFDIKPIMDAEMGHVRINEALIRNIENFVKQFINKDEEHVSFFGSNLTGVNRIIFSNEDRNDWAIDIADIDDEKIRKQVRELPHIGRDWKRGTDGVNLSLIYMCYLIHNSKLSDRNKQRGIFNCLVILQIKFLSSLLYGYFKYPVSEKLALAVYDSLSRKFYIKKYGTWQKILEARAYDIYIGQDTHKNTIYTFSSDEDIQYMITDIQTRIKSMILNIYEVTVQLNSKGMGTSASAMLMEGENGLELKDIEKQFDTYHDYLTTAIVDPKSLIKKELIDIVSESITTMPTKLLYDLLNHISNEYKDGNKKVQAMTREVLIFFFDYLKQNQRNVRDLTNLATLIKDIKATFTASKTSNKTVLELRDYFDKMVKKNIISKNPATIAGVRTGIILYIILRTLTKNYYN